MMRKLVLGGLAAMLLAGCSSLIGIANLAVSREGYSVVSDVAYGPDKRQALDFYVPDHPAKDAPVMLFFYGGSWSSGDKDYYRAFGQAFASKGILVAVADYRVYPAVRYPSFLEDCARAFAFVRDHARQHGGDPRHLFLVGHSAGGYNAVMLAANPAYLQGAGADISQVRGVIGIAGPYDFLPLTDPELVTIFGGARRPETQPITYVDGKRPPMLLTTGDDDTVVGPGNVTRMAAKLRSFGSSVETKTYPGVGHVGIILSLAPGFRGRTTLRQDMLDFIARH